MIFNSPLEQFSINKFIPIFIGTLDFSITNSSVLVFFACLLAFLFFSFAVANAKLVPSG
jgi:F0F1-type ATP synthase membrane subunit a